MMYQQGPLYLEDLEPGMHFAAPEWPVTADDIIRFATDFDPQPQHMDPDAAVDSFFGELVASGWHTAAMVMGMAMRSEMQMTGGQAGVNVERMRFQRTVRPGDTLRLDIEILEARRSRSLPRRGIVKYRWRCYNQDDELVMDIIATALVRARDGADAAATNPDAE